MGRLFQFLLSVGLLSTVLGQCNEENAEMYLTRSVNEFSNKLVGRISETTDNHFVASSLSPWTLLAAISFGAAEETLDELDDVLRLHKQWCFNRKFFEVVKGLGDVSDGVVFKRSATVFGDDRMRFRDSFKSKLSATGVTKLEEINFDSADEVAATINEYVKSATGGNIDEIVVPSDLYGIHVLFIDALYFKGTWRYKFDSAETEPSPFYDSNGQQIGDVNLMFAEMQAKVIDFTQIEASVLELPYARDDRFSMLFILPNEGVTIPSVIDKLQNFSVFSFLIQYRMTREQFVSVQIPRFQISSDHSNLKELLQDMGLRSMFESGAKFPELAEYSLYVDNVLQKATIEVTEEGSEASVASAASMGFRSMARPATVSFTANRPFLYMIVDRRTELPLFTGAYSKPSLY